MSGARPSTASWNALRNCSRRGGRGTAAVREFPAPAAVVPRRRVGIALLTLVLRGGSTAARRVRLRTPRGTRIPRAAAAVGRDVRRARCRGSRSPPRARSTSDCSASSPRWCRRLPGAPVWIAAVWSLVRVGSLELPVRRIPLGAGSHSASPTAGCCRSRALGGAPAAQLRGGADRHRAGSARASRSRGAARGALLGLVAALAAVIVVLASPCDRPCPAWTRETGPSRSPRSRAACRGSDWTSTPSARAVLDNHVEPHPRTRRRRRRRGRRRNPTS